MWENSAKKENEQVLDRKCSGFSVNFYIYPYIQLYFNKSFVLVLFIHWSACDRSNGTPGTVE